MNQTSALCRYLHQRLMGYPLLEWEPAVLTTLPSDFVYFIYERAEPCHHDCGGLRVVRVGTHKADLGGPHRIGQHFQGPRSPSIHRTHVHHARQASLGSSSDLRSLRFPPDVDRAMDHYFSRTYLFRVIPVQARRERVELERRAIATIAQCQVCHGSPDWLGLWSPRPTIRISGLWNVHLVNGQPFLRVDEIDEFIT